LAKAIGSDLGRGKNRPTQFMAVSSNFVEC
jgi:hypothetical protein